MNVLIADDVKIYRLAIKSYIHKLWPEAIVYEESNLDSVIKDVFDVEYDLLILATDMPGHEQIEDFIKQAIKYTKVIISCNCTEDSVKAKRLIELGADGFLSKTATEEEVISTLLFVFSESQ
jgi:DNA-binding NarL/FixJ family response regulator